jgi:HAD superfamily hydrolase (TIGR01509 family)
MIKGIAFDMDGTLTRPVIDFNQIRKAVGVADTTRPVFEQIQDMAGPEKKRALEILEQIEMEAADQSQPSPGVDSLVEFLEQRSIEKAIYTRNMKKALELTLSKIGLAGKFNPIVTRDHNLRLKPDPAMIFHILEEWGLAPGQVLVVGDFEFDIMAGKAANCRTVFLNNFAGKPGPASADFVIDRLDKLMGIIEDLNDS